MADPIKMTRAEYQAKFGTAPAVASAPTVTTPATPSIDTTTAPVKMTRAEYTAKFGTAPEIAPTAPAETPGYFSRVGSEIKGAFQGLQKTTERGAELMGEGRGVEGAVMSGLGAPAAVIRAAFSPLTAAVAPLISKGIESSGLAETETFQKGMQGLAEFAKTNPDAAENIKNIVEIGGTLIGAKGVTAVKPTAVRALDTTTEAVKTAGAFTRRVGEKVPEAVQAVKTAGSVVEDVISGAKRIPSRISTNIAERQETVQAIKALPTKTAQRAAQEGIDVPDVNIVSNLSKKVKPAARELAEEVKKFAKRETQVNPIASVGKPIVAKIKQLEAEKNSIGTQLGEVSKKLGVVTREEIEAPLFTALSKVRGLEGLAVDKDGLLDFRNTGLTTIETASDRTAIQSIYTQAIQGGAGEAKHKLRQELFEILGGKKRSLQNITGTQEEAYQAIRKGLSDVLDLKDDTYKQLNLDYAKRATPLMDLRKKLRAIDPNIAEDILDMNAGVLARRLDSASITQGDLRRILDAMDSATTVKGNLRATTEELQALYSVFNRYYDIAPRAGFQGGITGGIEMAASRGLGDLVAGAVKSVGGQTPAVRQKALESLLDEVLGVSKKSNFGKPVDVSKAIPKKKTELDTEVPLKEQTPKSPIENKRVDSIKMWWSGDSRVSQIPTEKIQKKVDSIINSKIPISEMPPIIIDKNGTIYDGQHRWLAAKQMGVKEVPTVIAKSEAEANKLIDFYNKPFVVARGMSKEEWIKGHTPIFRGQESAPQVNRLKEGATAEYTGTAFSRQREQAQKYGDMMLVKYLPEDKILMPKDISPEILKTLRKDFSKLDVADADSIPTERLITRVMELAKQNNKKAADIAEFFPSMKGEAEIRLLGKVTDAPTRSQLSAQYDEAVKASKKTNFGK